MTPLGQFRSPAPSLADRLNWAALVADGVVQTKCGAYLAGCYYVPPDGESAAPAERNQTAETISRALGPLAAGWVMWVDMVRVPSARYPDPSRSHFPPDSALARIEAERRAGHEAEGEHFVSERALLVMRAPPSAARRAAGRLGSSAPSYPQEDLNRFQAAVRDLVDRLSLALDVWRMGAWKGPSGERRDQLVDYLAAASTFETAPVNLPPSNMYLDALLGAPDLAVGNNPSVSLDGRPRHIAAIAISGFPSQSHPNILSVLESLPTEYRWSTRMIFLDREQALGELARYRRQWRQRTRGFMAQFFGSETAAVNQDAALMAAQAEDAMSLVQSDTVRFGYYTSVVILSGEDIDGLLVRARAVRKEIARLGFQARVETLNTMEAWLGSLPGHPHPNVRRPLIHTATLADLLPLSGIWPGDSVNPNPLYPADSPPLMHATTTGSTPFRLNLHVEDVGHTLIFGPTGAGKSTLLATLIAQFFRYENATVFALDQGRSLETLCRASDGVQLRPAGSAARASMAPLSFLDAAGDRGWALEWLCEMYELQASAPPSVPQRRDIAAALREMSQASPAHRSITDICATIQDLDMRAALAQYTAGHPAGAYLDGAEDEVSTGRFVTVEIGELLDAGEKTYIPVLRYLFRRFERTLTGQPALLVLGEAWAMLRNPVFCARIREWLKTLRKANCAVIIETQSLADAVKSDIYDVLIESCPTKILLPNPEADKTGTPSAPGPRDYYAMMGLTETDIETLKHAEPKKHYLYASRLGRRLFDLNLGPVAKAFVAVSDRESLAAREQVERDRGDAWPAAWLAHRAGVEWGGEAA